MFKYNLYLYANNLQNETELQQREQKKQEGLCWLIDLAKGKS